MIFDNYVGVSYINSMPSLNKDKNFQKVLVERNYNINENNLDWFYFYK